MRYFKDIHVIEQRVGDLAGEGPWMESVAWKKSRAYITFEKELTEYTLSLTPISYATPEKYAKALYQLRKTPFAWTVLVRAKICLLPLCSRADTFRYGVRRAASDNPEALSWQRCLMEAYTAEEQPCQLQPGPPFINTDQGPQNTWELMKENKQNEHRTISHGENNNSMEEGILLFCKWYSQLSEKILYSKCY